MSDETEDAIRRKGQSQTEGLGLFAKPKTPDEQVEDADERGKDAVRALARREGLRVECTTGQWNRVDAYLYDGDDNLVAVAEAKTRRPPYTRAYLRRMPKHPDTMILQDDKLESLRKRAIAGRCEGWLVVELADCSRYLFVVFDADGQPLGRREHEATVTRLRSTDDERGKRDNVFLHFEDALCFGAAL